MKIRFFRLPCFWMILLVTQLVAAPHVEAATSSAARCLRGDWVSTEYGQQAIVAALGAIPYTSVVTDTSAISFANGLYALESLLVLETVDDAGSRSTRVDGSAAASYRVRTSGDGKTFIAYSNSTEEKLFVYSTAGGITIGPTILENVFMLNSARVPFTCRGRRLTIKVAGPSGQLTPIKFTRP